MKYLPPECRTREKFLECAIPQMRSYYRYHGPIIQSTEVVITDNYHYSKYRGAKLLVVGGGPSTNDVEWDSRDYDFVISCNHFFNHPKLKDVDLASLSPEVDVASDAFQNYYRSSKTFFLFENVDCDQTNVQNMLSLGRSGIAIIRWKDKTGSVGRLLVILSSFLPQSIDVVGMDGMPRGMGQGDDSKHAFEPGKPIKSKYYSYDFYYEQYKQLWGYLKSEFPVKYKNLGHGHPYNISTNFNIC